MTCSPALSSQEPLPSAQHNPSPKVSDIVKEYRYLDSKQIFSFIFSGTVVGEVLGTVDGKLENVGRLLGVDVRNVDGKLLGVDVWLGVDDGNVDGKFVRQDRYWYTL